MGLLLRNYLSIEFLYLDIVDSMNQLGWIHGKFNNPDM